MKNADDTWDARSPSPNISPSLPPPPITEVHGTHLSISPSSLSPHAACPCDPGPGQGTHLCHSAPLPPPPQLAREAQDLAKGREQVAKLATETAALQVEAHKLRTQPKV